MSKSASVRIVEQFGSDENCAVLASAGIALTPTAMAKAQAFTASAERKAMDVKARWDRVIAPINARNARFRS